MLSHARARRPAAHPFSPTRINAPFAPISANFGNFFPKGALTEAGQGSCRESMGSHFFDSSCRVACYEVAFSYASVGCLQSAAIFSETYENGSGARLQPCLRREKKENSMGTKTIQVNEAAPAGNVD